MKYGRALGARSFLLHPSLTGNHSGKTRHISRLVAASAADCTAGHHISGFSSSTRQGRPSGSPCSSPIRSDCRRNLSGWAISNFLLTDKFYRASFVTTAIFSILVTLCSMVPALLLAVIADRLIQESSGVYRTLLIWPYAVAPAVAGVLWLFMFNTRVGIVSWYLGQLGYDWNHVLNGGEAMGLASSLPSAWGRISYNFLFFFAALQSVPKAVIEAAAIDGARFWKRFFTIVLPLLSPTTFFLLVVNVGLCLL